MFRDFSGGRDAGRGSFPRTLRLESVKPGDVGIHSLLKKRFCGPFFYISVCVEDFRHVGDVDLGLLHGRDIQGNKALSQVVIRAKRG